MNARTSIRARCSTRASPSVRGQRAAATLPIDYSARAAGPESVTGADASQRVHLPIASHNSKAARTPQHNNRRQAHICIDYSRRDRARPAIVYKRCRRIVMPPSRTSASCYVGGLSEEATEETLHAFSRSATR